MTKRSIGTALVIALVFSWGGAASAQQAKCLAGKTKCMSKKAGGLLKCEQTAETPGKPTDTSACRAKVVVKFDGGTEQAKGCFEKLENKAGTDCITHDDTAAAEDAVDSCVGAFVAAIDPPPPNQTKCGAGKKKCVSKLLGALLKCQATAQTPGKPTDQSACVDKAKTKYNGGTEFTKGCFAKLEAKDPNDCQPPTNNSDALQTLVEDCVDDLVAVVVTTTTSTTNTTTTTTTTTSSTTSTPTTTTTTTTVLACNPVDCDDMNACTTDTCDPAIGVCVHTDVVCHDDIDCTVDFCDQSIGCVHQPDDSFCFSNDPCKVAVCDVVLGCTDTDINCDDHNACTIDTCNGGQCLHSPDTSRCNDNLRCTDDICSPCTADDADPTCRPSPEGRFKCVNPIDRSNCGILQSCQTALCSPGQDCTVQNNDNLCPAFPDPAVQCLAPQCTASGCGFRDTCSAANPQCNGCPQCTCNTQAKRCVPSCPS